MSSRSTVSWEARADLVVVGTGVAGLTAALETRDLGLPAPVTLRSGIRRTLQWARTYSEVL